MASLITIEDVNPDHYLAVIIIESLAENSLNGLFESSIGAKELFFISKQNFWSEISNEYSLDAQLGRVIDAGKKFNRSNDPALGVILDYSNLARMYMRKKQPKVIAPLLDSFVSSAQTMYSKCNGYGPRTHDIILELLPFILEYKIKNEQSFKSSDKIFGYLNSKQQMDFLFNVDCLV